LFYDGQTISQISHSELLQEAASFVAFVAFSRAIASPKHKFGGESVFIFHQSEDNRLKSHHFPTHKNKGMIVGGDQ